MALSLTRRRNREGWVFVLPWIVGFLVFVAWPLGYSLFLSFHRVSPAGFRVTPVGLANYINAFAVDTVFLERLGRTVGRVFLDTPVIMVFSLAVAVLLNRKLPGRAFVRALFFLPVVIGSGYVLQELFQQGVGGVAVALGGGGGDDSVSLASKSTRVVDVTRLLADFLGSSVASAVTGFLNRLGLSLWKSGIQIILFLAALQGISRTLYEAGRIDGANEWVLFWHVTFPIISPVMVAVVIFTVVDSFTDVFNQVLDYITTQGIEKQAYGFSAAMAWIYFLVIFLILAAFLASIRRRVFYRGAR